MGPRRRGRPVAKCKDRVKEFMYKRVAVIGGEIKLVRSDCLDRKRWRLFRHGHPLGERFQREQGIRNYR